jgi:hypothetical protein
MDFDSPPHLVRSRWYRTLTFPKYLLKSKERDGRRMEGRIFFKLQKKIGNLYEEK